MTIFQESVQKLIRNGGFQPNKHPPAGRRTAEIGGAILRDQMRQPHWMTQERPNRFARMVLDRWAMEYPNQVRMLSLDPMMAEDLIEEAIQQGEIEMELLTNPDAVRSREQGMMDSDILRESGIRLGIAPSLPYRHMDH